MIIKAATEKDVVICGESEPGKELVAHTIHQLSSRQQQAALARQLRGHYPEPLFESEFFGYCKGRLQAQIEINRASLPQRIKEPCSWMRLKN